mmetsp:Transcript_35311/g.89376  ORF Transcript_35311/g.89376 Transcript_35311/m.89376 type:complete len:360 (-) Transcript_35311:414-1493(-)|eukprot:CAMPEP_0202869574 /NCGR_PEP_ID=MMETSP1391-20130828/12528_1 /ASSEMBLY_ACC=CAM_ASM_000867 /TAXON_ID=1034604 /ORGANISM="Chlamydomonas leiostraca, Strain SAG 11-49" /LENGTH=359 /DNA_ID=CAMNT_0049549911 /DNA_START=93 /DNA_END=1172 /DNA_ORIENTATION=+
MGKKEKQAEAKSSKKALPEHLELQRTHVVCGPERNAHTSTFTSANVFMPLGVDNAWNLDDFKSDFQIKVHKLEDEVMEFDMVGCDPAVANALRRILIAEVPTVAIEHVFMINNTSIIQDEVFAHRLGMVPLRVDPAKLEPKVAEEAPGEKNTLVFRLDVTCRRDKDGNIENDKVLSSELRWLRGGSEIPDETGCRFAAGQGHMFTEAEKPRAVHDDILLAKLRPGQSITLEAHAVKGIGKDHAKFSPVATAWYKLLPEVVLLKEPPADVAERLLAAAPGLFTREGGQLRVHAARDHQQHLEKVRALLEDEAVAACMQYRKKKDHFMFTIESSGVLPPEVLFEQALGILHDKAHKLAQRL